MLRNAPKIDLETNDVEYIDPKSVSRETNGDVEVVDSTCRTQSATNTTNGFHEHTNSENLYKHSLHQQKNQTC